MKFFIIIISIIILIFAVYFQFYGKKALNTLIENNFEKFKTNSSVNKVVPIHENVMFGYKDYNDYLQKQPENFKNTDTSHAQAMFQEGKFKDKKEASQHYCQLAYAYYPNAIASEVSFLNLAWLLDSTQPCVYAGYGHFYAYVEDNQDKSFEMYEKALSLSNPSSPNDSENSWFILTDYAEVLDACFTKDTERKDCLEKAKNNLTKSLSIKDAPKTHRVLAFVYYHEGDYKKSWDEVHLAIDRGVSEKLMSGFINDLKKKMPDPKGQY